MAIHPPSPIVRAGIATMPSRKHMIGQVVDSLYHQVDEIFVCLNNYDKVPETLKRDKVFCVIPGKDLTDNGKFIGYAMHNGVYLSCDDDIIYPHNYAQVVLANLAINPVITFHGRRLIEENLSESYYRSHDFYHCMHSVETNVYLDVPGTGVSAYDTDIIDLSRVAFSDIKCMSDLLVGLELAEQGVSPLCIAHRAGWFKYNEPPQGDTIFEKYINNDELQRKIAKEIWKLKYQQA